MASGETVRVIVRCRPMNQRENDLKCQSIVTMNNQANQVMLANIDQSNEPPKQFTFDAVYAEDSITETLYADSVFPLVESVLEGYNGTVFAYGQTGCGKSFTMQGINTPGSPQRGVIPRSFEHIFEASSVASGTKYLIRASYLEIYNESIRDLLSKDVKATLELKEFVDKGVQVQNLTWHQCSSVLDCEKLMDKGNRSRATGATLMNKDSSRSHSIFTILTEMCSRSEIDGKEHIRAGKLNLVDLAGSERQSKTQAEGERLREATRINLSLSALGNVISALVDGRSKHIPYRDSKLTRLLQDSLGGNTKTLMVAAISPAHDNYDETLSTLRYANRAKNIKNKPRINEDPRDAQMKLLQEEINRLKQELLSAGGAGVRPNQVLPPEGQSNHDEEIEREKERLREEFEREISEIRRQCDAERLTKEDLQKKYEDLKLQYDCEVDALNANKSNAEAGKPTAAPTATERPKGRKKTAKDRSKRDGPAGDQENQGDGSSPGDEQLTEEQKLERLQELESKLVGGEAANNEERKKKRKKKLSEMKEKQEQRKRLTNAINMDDDDAMIRVFDDVQDKLHFTMSRLEEERTESKRLKNDNEDLQHEFERERQEYLQTIREQERRMLLYRAMLSKMAMVIPRNCNYANLDRIMEQAQFDDDKNVFLLPEPVREEVQFPQVSGQQMMPNGNGRGPMIDSMNVSRTGMPPSSADDYEDDFDEPNPIQSNPYANPSMMAPTTTATTTNMANMEDLERRYGRSGESSSLPPEETRNRRQEQLLTENSVLQRAKRPLQMNNVDNDYMNRRLNPFEAPTRLTRKYGFPSDKP